MREHGCVRARRVRALRHLGQLVRVAEQHEVPRRRAHGKCVRERELAALVDEERVHMAAELLAREQERRAGEEQRVLVKHGGVVAHVLDQAAAAVRGPRHRPS